MAQRSHWEHLFHQVNFGLARGRFLDNRFVWVNEAFARQRGYLVDELVGQPIDQLVAARYEKFRRMGVFLESAGQGQSEHSDSPPSTESADSASPTGS